MRNWNIVERRIAVLTFVLAFVASVLSLRLCSQETEMMKLENRTALAAKMVRCNFWKVHQVLARAVKISSRNRTDEENVCTAVILKKERLRQLRSDLETLGVFEKCKETNHEQNKR